MGDLFKDADEIITENCSELLEKQMREKFISQHINKLDNTREYHDIQSYRIQETGMDFDNIHYYIYTNKMYIKMPFDILASDLFDLSILNYNRQISEHYSLFDRDVTMHLLSTDRKYIITNIDCFKRIRYCLAPGNYDIIVDLNFDNLTVFMEFIKELHEQFNNINHNIKISPSACIYDQRTSVENAIRYVNRSMYYNRHGFDNLLYEEDYVDEYISRLNIDFISVKDLEHIQRYMNEWAYGTL